MIETLLKIKIATNESVLQTTCLFPSHKSNLDPHTVATAQTLMVNSLFPP